ncbi:MAG: hypothetical protein NC911_09625 [Candidatus Omnitrophica bacterium]|nr:hypothetical protein [Candidatus Omnitrophota bacterium]
MTSRERISRVLAGLIPDRVPVSLYRLNPFDPNSFWAQHPSCRQLLEAARQLQDTFFFYQPRTGFFFSAPESVTLKVAENQDTAISRTISLTVETPLGPLTRVARRTTVSSIEWVQKPWIEKTADIEKFLSLPYTPYRPDLSDFFQQQKQLGEQGMMVVRLPDPLGVVGTLFAPGDLAKFALEQPQLISRLLEQVQERLLPLYQYVGATLDNAIIRIRGSEYVTPPALPREYFRDIRRIFSDYVIQYDRALIETLRRPGRRLYLCFHWHEFVDTLVPLILKLEPNIVEPIANTQLAPNTVLRARKVFGNNLVLMGGLTAEDLEFSDPEDISQRVKDVILQGGRQGRFILISCGLPTSVPLAPTIEQNYLAFLQAGHQFGSYPLR